MSRNRERSTRRRGGLLASTLATIVIVSWGCGDGGKPPVSTSTTEAKVKGKVLVKGKPATSGVVSFDPSNYVRKMAPVNSATINPDGTYEVTTLVGKNTISFSGRSLGPYLNLTLSLDVQEGENTFDIVLPVEGSP